MSAFPLPTGPVILKMVFPSDEPTRYEQTGLERGDRRIVLHGGSGGCLGLLRRQCQ